MGNLPSCAGTTAENVSQAGLIVDQPYSLCGQIGSEGGLIEVSLWSSLSSHQPLSLTLRSQS